MDPGEEDTVGETCNSVIGSAYRRVGQWLDSALGTSFIHGIGIASEGERVDGHHQQVKSENTESG